MTQPRENPDYGWEVPEFDIGFWEERKHPWIVVIPVKNEGGYIGPLLERMHHVVSGIADILIVDAGSTDMSLEPAALVNAGVTGLLVMKEKGGLSSQLRCAYSFCLREGYQGIVTIDGNNKDDPSLIPKFIDLLKAGYDFVQASRYIPGGTGVNTPRHRELAIRFLSRPLIALASGFKWTDSTQGFRAYSRRLLMDERLAVFRKVFVAYELLFYLSFRAPRLGLRCIEQATTRSYPADTVPTKIRGLRGYVGIMKSIVWACTGRYNPKVGNRPA